MVIVPAVHRDTFFSVRLTEHLDILFEDINMINLSDLRKHLDNKSDAFRVGPLYICLKESESPYVEFRGILLSCGKWMTCSNISDTVTIPIECPNETVYQAFEYLYHLLN